MYYAIVSLSSIMFRGIGQHFNMSFDGLLPLRGGAQGRVAAGGC